MKFKQTLTEFLGSKTNLLGLSAIASGIVGYYTNTLGPVECVQLIFTGLGFIFVKDAIAGTK